MYRVWRWEDVKEVWERRFIHRNTALEVLLQNGKSYFFNCFSSDKLKEALVQVKHKTKAIHRVFGDRKRRRAAIALRSQWLKGQTTNFEYLTALNKLSSRSFNEMSQYPVFPWVVKNYACEELDLTGSVFRDFDQNVGAQLAESRNEAQRRYELMEEAGMEPCHFGSHYSTGGVVSYYLIRLEPYVSAAIDLQDNTFDVADRIFASLEIAWKGCLNNSGDFKELIPEFFCLPEALLNLNGYDFGLTQAKTVVSDVALPRWAGTDCETLQERLRNAYNFVRIHERALECPIVRRALPGWIDLIFGFKQKIHRAKDYVNVFFPYTYQEKFELALKTAPETDREGIRQQVVYYGQTPLLLFNESAPHPRPTEFPPFEGLFDSVYTRAWEVNTKKIDTSKIAKLLYCDGRFAVLSTKRSVKLIGKRNSCGFYRENAKEPVEEVQLKVDSKLMEAIQEMAVETSQSFLFIGGVPHCSFLVCSLETGEVAANAVHHSLPVTCLSHDSGVLAAGSEDCTISLWSVTRSWVRGSGRGAVKFTQVLYGHRYPITACALSVKADVVASSDRSGVVLVHSWSQCVVLGVVEVDPHPVTLLSISRLRLLAVYSAAKQEIKVFTLSGQALPSIPTRLNRDPLKFLSFISAGDRLVTASSSLAIYNVFQNHSPPQDSFALPMDSVWGICIARDTDTLLIQTSGALYLTATRTAEGRGSETPRAQA